MTDPDHAQHVTSRGSCDEATKHRSARIRERDDALRAVVRGLGRLEQRRGPTRAEADATARRLLARGFLGILVLVGAAQLARTVGAFATAMGLAAIATTALIWRGIARRRAARRDGPRVF